MPGPFPGMDPFIEGQRWSTFHSYLTPTIGEALTPRIRPAYLVTVEERVYLEHSPGEETPHPIRPDATILKRAGIRPVTSSSGNVAVAEAPVQIVLPIPESVTERYLTVRDRKSMEGVTVIDVLSPGNKRMGSDGRREYLQKRDTVLLSQVHLVEVDLLRGGERLPGGRLPPTDYCVVVSRTPKRPVADPYPWRLRNPLPSIKVPLKTIDDDILLDLQTVYTTAYERAGFDYSLDYSASPVPPLCLLYTSPSPRDLSTSRMPSSA